MMKKQFGSTSWTLTYFWMVLTTILATLSTFSLVQVDWLVKRETLIVTHYHVPSANKSNTLFHIGRDFGNASESKRQSLSVLYTYVNKEFNKDSLRSWNWTVVKKVKSTVTVFSWGVFGTCVNYPGLSNQCGLHKEKNGNGYLLGWVLTLTGGLGCLTLCSSAIMSILAVALPTSQLRYQVARTIGHAQAVSVLLLFLCVLAFPLGFETDTVKYHCGPNAGPFSVDDCEIGWAYALLIVTTSLALYCPVLVYFTITDKQRKKQQGKAGQCLPKYM